jgi:hypothetical protein
MTTSDDPEHPDNVVLVIKAQFPTSDTDYEAIGPTSELIGTLNFERAHVEIAP